MAVGLSHRYPGYDGYVGASERAPSRFKSGSSDRPCLIKGINGEEMEDITPAGFWLPNWQRTGTWGTWGTV